jgi:hypothetical protein
VPKAGRTPYLGHERKLFDTWKRSAAEHQVSSFHTDWDWLAIAQHHRLATRLLDWTTNPLNAAYFAVRDDAAGPAIIHAARFEVARTKPHETLLQQEPLAVAGVYMFRPRSGVPRIVCEGGLFTGHGPPELALDDTSNQNFVTVERIVIDPSYRRQLMGELARYGVHSASLFPDLDGLSTYLNWRVESAIEDD